MRRRRPLGRCAAAAGLVLACVLVPARLPAEVIKELRVVSTGAGPAPRDSVLAFITTREGQEFEPTLISRDLQALQKTGRFADVRVSAEHVPGGIALRYEVQANPIIRTLRVNGAEFLGNHKVRNLMELGAGDLVSDAILSVRAQKVRESYAKHYYPDARLTWTITPDPARGMVDVAITVQEGRKAFVKRIRFTGNAHYQDRELRRVMKQRQANWLSWITSQGMFNEDDVIFDRELLRRAFLNRGYLDVTIGEPDIRMIGRRWIEVTVPVTEGPLYQVGRVTLAGTQRFPEAEVARVLRLKPGQPAAISAVETNLQALSDFYGSRGYLKTGVDYQLDTPGAAPVADVAFKVREGAPAHIRNIEIRGNTRTKDKVIRRELTVAPGDLYNTVKVRNSERRIRNLGFFSYVNSFPQSTLRADQYDLILDVEEQRTGAFNIGAGFSSIDQVVAFAELSQGNFDISNLRSFTGAGQKMKVRVQGGTKRSDYELEFIEPWFLNRQLSLGVDLFQHESRYFSDEYDQRNRGFNVTLGKPLNSFDRINLTYGLEQVEIYNVPTNASELLIQEEGKRLVSSMTLELLHDSRDNAFIPTRGNRSSLAATLAGGPLGADTDFYKFQARTSQFWTPWLDHVFNLRGWAGYVEQYDDTERVPLFDRFFLGGPNTLRGFKYRKVGPKDEDEEPVGGKTAAYFIAEYSVPIAQYVRVAAFYDGGLVWARMFEKDEEEAYVGDGMFNSDLGVGVRLDFPGFPIQLDYAWPLKADEMNDRPQGRFSFWIGYKY